VQFDRDTKRVEVIILPGGAIRVVSARTREECIRIINLIALKLEQTASDGKTYVNP
jgi:hypothetical protein